MNKDIPLLLICMFFLWVNPFLSGQESSENVKINRNGNGKIKVSENWGRETPEVYQKPENAVRDFRGDVIPYVLWLDPYIWHEVKNINIHAERSFKTENGEAVAFIVVHTKPVNLDKLNEVAVNNAKASGMDNIQVVEEENHTVNGLKVLFIHWKATLNGVNVDVLSYIHSGPSGTIVLHAYTPSTMYDRNLKILEDFLNGLTLKKES